MTWPFENNTSAIVKKIADRSMKADKRRNAFIIITITFVTHDPIIASSCDRIIFLKDGKVKEDLKRTGDKEQFYNEIITNWC